MNIKNKVFVFLLLGYVIGGVYASQEFGEYEEKHRAEVDQCALNAELVRACYQGKLPLVQSLIDRGADVNKGDCEFNMWPLLAAVQKCKLNPRKPYYELVTTLLKAGADGERKLGPTTAFIQSLIQGSSGAVMAFIDFLGIGIVDEPSSNGAFPIYIVVENQEVTDVLFAAGADPKNCPIGVQFSDQKQKIIDNVTAIRKSVRANPDITVAGLVHVVGEIDPLVAHFAEQIIKKEKKLIAQGE